jgi:hypothetical protein
VQLEPSVIQFCLRNLQLKTKDVLQRGVNGGEWRRREGRTVLHLVSESFILRGGCRFMEEHGGAYLYSFIFKSRNLCTTIPPIYSNSVAEPKLSSI